jgi:hypothetical protein
MSGAAAQPFLFQLLSVSIEATQAAGKLNSPRKNSLLMYFLRTEQKLLFACLTGKIIRRIMKEGSLATIDKAVNDPQTEADRQVCWRSNLNPFRSAKSSYCGTANVNMSITDLSLFMLGSYGVRSNQYFLAADNCG